VHDNNNNNESIASRVTAHSYGALDVSTADELCWLIRLPTNLAELWDAAPEGTVLGDMIFCQQSTAGTTATPTSSSSSTSTSTTTTTTTTAAVKNTSSFSKPTLTVHVSDELVAQFVQHQHRREKESKQTRQSKSSSGLSTIPSSNSIPLRYTIEAMTKKIPVMHPFVRNQYDGTCTILGTISRTANLQVDQTDGKYRNLLKDRLLSTAVTSQRFVKPLSTTESVLSKHRSVVIHPNITSTTTTSSISISQSQTGITGSVPRSFGNAVLQYGKRKLERQSTNHYRHSDLSITGDDDDDTNTMDNGNAKKSRLFSPDQPMKSVLFALFSKQTYWTVKDMKSAAAAGGAMDATTKRGEQEIRDILRDIGDYHRAGDYKNMWSLKEEFQVQQQQQQQQQQSQKSKYVI
jgi:hypothetical protein